MVNSYYSNLIEGHSTHPVDIERAMQQDYSADQEKRDFHIESRIHIEVQEEIAERLRREPDLNVASSELLLWCTSGSIAGCTPAMGEGRRRRAGLRVEDHDKQTDAAGRVMDRDREALRKLSE